MSQGRAILPYEFTEHEWRIRISPIPRTNTRGGPARAIASRMLNPLAIQPQEPIKAAILSKASRYGQPDLPYVIAINTLDQYAGLEDAIDALSGTLGVEDRQTPDGWESHHVRMPDGVWQDYRGPTNTRVSAVLSTERLTPWDLGQRSIRLILNPWASRPLINPFTDVTVLEPREGRLHKDDGRPLYEIFGLEEGWPE